MKLSIWQSFPNLALSKKKIPAGLLNTIKRCRPVYAFARWARFRYGSWLGARVVPGIPGRCHYNDYMLYSTDPEDIANYRRIATDFVDIIEASLRKVGRDWPSVQKSLEIGCGYGRIVRVLKERLPASHIHVCDVIPEGPKFTAAEFGAKIIPVLESADSTFDNSFDLVYLLSVYTHMKRDDIATNLKAINRVLKPGGILVFTSMGEISARTAERYGHYWLDKEELNKAVFTDGYYFGKFPFYGRDYGMTWFSEASMKKLVREAASDLRLVDHRPAGLDSHADVFVYCKA